MCFLSAGGPLLRVGAVRPSAAAATVGRAAFGPPNQRRRNRIEMATLITLPDCKGWSVLMESSKAWKLVEPSGLVLRHPVYPTFDEAEASCRVRCQGRRQHLAEEQRNRLKGGLDR